MSDTTRTTRNTRESETRKPTWAPPGRLDTPEPREGYRYRWVRFELLGENQDANVYNRERQHYRPVMAEELAAAMDLDMVGDGRHEGVVRSGDLILMEVPEEVAQQRREYFDSRARRMQAAVDHELDTHSSDEMPISRRGSKSTVSVGQPREQGDVDFDDD